MKYKLNQSFIFAAVFILAAGRFALASPLMEAAFKGNTENEPAWAAHGADVNAKTVKALQP